MTPPLLLFDLFGTLARPVSGETIRAWLESEAVCLDERLWPVVSGGFPAAMLLPEMGCRVSDVAPRHLTGPMLASVPAFVQAVLTTVPGTRAPAAASIRLVERCTARCVEGARLHDDAAEILNDLVARSIGTQLVSDVSVPFATVIDLLGLRGWFPHPVLSFETGRLKQSGAAFQPYRASAVRACMIGDRWQSDVLGALRAGLPAVLVDREGRSPARLLLDSPELFFATDGTVPPSTLPGLSRLIGTTPEALEGAPEEHFEFEGAQPVRWRQADKVRIVGGLFEVSTALAGLGLA